MIPADDPSARKFWLAMRQVLLMALGAIEDMLGLRRSVVPKRKRKQSDKLTPKTK